MMIKRRRFAGPFVLMSAIALGAPPADALPAQGRGRGPAKAAEKADKQADKQDKKQDKQHGRTDNDVVVDRDGHVRVIREHVRGGSLPPGLAKREALPPGLRKQLRERGTLPPGLQKHLVRVDGPFVTRLPAVPSHFQRYFAGDDLIVVDTRTNRIVTIIRDVWG